MDVPIFNPEVVDVVDRFFLPPISRWIYSGIRQIVRRSDLTSNGGVNFEALILELQLNLSFASIFMILFVSRADRRVGEFSMFKLDN